MKTKKQIEQFIDLTGKKVIKDVIKANKEYGGLPICYVIDLVYKVIYKTIKFCNK